MGPQESGCWLQQTCDLCGLCQEQNLGSLQITSPMDRDPDTNTECSKISRQFEVNLNILLKNYHACFFVFCLATRFQRLSLYSLEWKDDTWMMNWKGCGRRQSSWPNLKYYPSICLQGLRKTTKNLSENTGLRTEIWTQKLQNSKQDCSPLGHDICQITCSVFLDEGPVINVQKLKGRMLGWLFWKNKFHTHNWFHINVRCFFIFKETEGLYWWLWCFLSESLWKTHHKSVSSKLWVLSKALLKSLHVHFLLREFKSRQTTVPIKLVLNCKSNWILTTVLGSTAESYGSFHLRVVVSSCF
jgi:hypothetical protein